MIHAMYAAMMTSLCPVLSVPADAILVEGQTEVVLVASAAQSTNRSMCYTMVTVIGHSQSAISTQCQSHRHSR